MTNSVGTSSQPEEVIRGIPASKWKWPALMDEARMTDKQRLAYFMQMERANIALLMSKGNFVGEKPDHALDLHQMVKQREEAFQRAMKEQLELYSD